MNRDLLIKIERGKLEEYFYMRTKSFGLEHLEFDIDLNTESEIDEYLLKQKQKYDTI